MDKRCSKLFLFIVLISTIILIISLSFITNYNLSVEDIYGDRSALGDMNIVYQRKKGLYETDKIIISKDNEEIKKYEKEGCRGFSISSENIENRHLLESINDKSDIWEDENEIVTVSLFNSSYSYNQNEITVEINIKNKKTKKVEEYNINIDNIIDYDMEYKLLPIKNNNNIYLSVISSVYNNNNLENNEIYSQTYLSLYKLNLSTQQSQCIINKSYDPNEMYTDGNIGFVKNNISYFVVSMGDENNKEKRTCLFTFNVITKDIKIIDLQIGSESVTNYFLNDNEVLLSCEEDKANKTVKILTIDLNTNKIKNINEINVKSSDNNNKNILDIRVYKNKIYLVINDQTLDDYSENNMPRDVNCYIYVVDEENNNTLYIGKIKEKYIHNVSFAILKKEEI